MKPKKLKQKKTYKKNFMVQIWQQFLEHETQTMDNKKERKTLSLKTYAQQKKRRKKLTEKT